MSLVLLALEICIMVILVNCIKDCGRHKRRVDQHQCELFPQTYEGPLYINDNLVRSNITEYRPGVPFRITMKFTNAETCMPIPDLMVDTWMCDAIGYYSHYLKIDPTKYFDADKIRHATPTDGSTFLRGTQQTDGDGRVSFDALLPGWYANRTRHIHFKVHHKHHAIFTGQLFFPEHLSDWITGIFPYYVQNRVFNKEDYIYTNFNGKETTIYNIKPIDKRRPTDGFVGNIVIGLNLESKDFGNGPQ